MQHDITRHTHFKDFTILPNELTQSEEMSFSAKGLLCYLLSLPEDWSINVAYIAKTFHVSERSILKDLQQLIRLGYCMRTPKRIDNKMNGQRYQITDIPNEFTAPLKNEGTGIAAPPFSRPTGDTAPRESEGTYKEYTIYKEHNNNKEYREELDLNKESETLSPLNIKNTSPVTIQEREKAFREKLRPFMETYGPDMLNAFYLHWSEPTRDGKQMKWEREKTWDLRKRLQTWSLKDKQWNRRSTPVVVPIQHRHEGNTFNGISADELHIIMKK